MVKIDIISGFLGAGKTTLIQKLLKEALAGSKVVLIDRGTCCRWHCHDNGWYELDDARWHVSC